MLVRKGGITRDIAPKNLQAYKDKGYVPVPEAPETKKPGK